MALEYSNISMILSIINLCERINRDSQEKGFQMENGILVSLTHIRVKCIKYTLNQELKI